MVVCGACTVGKSTVAARAFNSCVMKDPTSLLFAPQTSDVLCNIQSLKECCSLSFVSQHHSATTKHVGAARVVFSVHIAVGVLLMRCWVHRMPAWMTKQRVVCLMVRSAPRLGETMLRCCRRCKYCVSGGATRAACV
jgi:hypothetical protein